MKRPSTATACLAVAALAALVAAAGCSSSSSSTTSTTVVHGTETLSAALSGKSAAANLNSNSSAPLSFPKGTLSGPVSSSITPFVLKGSGNKAADVTWTTTVGNLTIYHSASQGGNAQPTWTLKSGVCFFKADFGYGTFNYVPSKSTGTWARVSGTGKFTINAVGAAPLNKGKTTCSENNTGNVMTSGAAVTFAAVAPVTLSP